MSSVLRAAVPLLLVLSIFAWPASGEPTCGTVPGPSDALQDDAGSGGDAGDALFAPLEVERDGTWSGALDAPMPHPGDQADAYTVPIGAVADTVMVELTSYTGDTVLDGQMVVDVFRPGATEPTATVPMGAGEVTLSAEPGTWAFLVRYTITNGDGCAAGEAVVAAPLVPQLLKTYTFYVGCDPVCV